VEKERLLKVKEACAALKIHPNTLRRWEKSGKIKVLRTAGGKRRIPESEVRRLLIERGAVSEPRIAPKKKPTGKPGLTSPLPAGLVLLGTTLLLSYPLLFQGGNRMDAASHSNMRCSLCSRPPPSTSSGGEL
jgi:excisionase family DNA binding protein